MDGETVYDVYVPAEPGDLAGLSVPLVTDLPGRPRMNSAGFLEVTGTGGYGKEKRLFLNMNGYSGFAIYEREAAKCPTACHSDSSPQTHEPHPTLSQLLERLAVLCGPQKSGG